MEYGGLSCMGARMGNMVGSFWGSIAETLFAHVAAVTQAAAQGVAADTSAGQAVGEAAANGLAALAMATAESAGSCGAPAKKVSGPGMTCKGGGLPLDEIVEGAFSITDWTGYPDGPRPSGPFRMIDGGEYKTARNAANAANRRLHKLMPGWSDLEIHEIHPVKFGGCPTSIGNKMPLARKAHDPYSRFWANMQHYLNGKTW